MSGNTEPSTFFSSIFGAGGPGAGVPGVPEAYDIEVAPDKIVEVASVLDEQAGVLQRQLAQHLAALRIPPPSEDIVSTHAVEAWNHVIADGDGSYERRVRAYVEELRDLAEQLRDAARRYGVNEDEQAAALGDRHGHGG